MRKRITAAIAFILPSRFAIRILNLLGHDIHPTVYIGWSWCQCEKLHLQANSRIGHFNILRIPTIYLGEAASIRNFNRMKGPFNLHLEEKAAIGNSNSIYRGSYPITIGQATLRLGVLAIITSKHQLDCTCSISIGDYSTISGFATQFWTHGFYHADQGPDRIRIDGPIEIGENVSIGSRCLINPGIKIGNAINVGGNVCVSKSLLAPGMYISQSLRHIPNSMDQIKNKLVRNEKYTIVNVYEKAIA